MRVCVCVYMYVSLCLCVSMCVRMCVCGCVVMNKNTWVMYKGGKEGTSLAIQSLSIQCLSMEEEAACDRPVERYQAPPDRQVNRKASSASERHEAHDETGE